ncbi:Zn(II)2Cys6 transcription factor [Aspergillus terreus]|uniref:Zn(II)2Cys6 transcription factor n=1 Tax=Aspergillus terreus TaxID=33178 RepID=A0A5M3YUH9_ASPTE|nr:hypothetical protein ATETN484_0003087400 [Aspergillus terreus]GFF14860.1 Zn(II)2Cys6 transcription factor [Aspergillus terreus]
MSASSSTPSSVEDRRRSRMIPPPPVPIAPSVTPATSRSPSERTAPKVAIPRLENRKDKVQRQRALRACVPCRDRKTKCDGHMPVCRQCSLTGIECTWTWSKRERKEWELEAARSKIHAYEALLAEILAKSRADNLHSIEDIFSKHFQTSPAIFASLLVSRSLLDQHLPPARPGISLRRMHLASTDTTGFQPLCSKPSFQTSQVQNWTSFVDNDTASHLLSLYFAWENPVWHLVDQDMFLHDLETGGRRFCSPLLVHVLLFFGVSISYDLGQITNRREEKVLGKQLYDAIQRLWELEKTDACLPTAQASILIGLLCCTFGIDRIGTRYILHGAELAQQFGLDRDGAGYFATENTNLIVPIHRCQTIVAWAFFDIQALAAQVYRKGPVWLEPPSVRFTRGETHLLDNDANWIPYPFAGPIYPSLTFTSACARSDLVEIVHKIALFSRKFPSSAIEEDDWVYGSTLYQRLVSWRENLPTVLLPNETPCPHIICLHMYYHVSVVSLCDIFNLHSDPSIPEPTTPAQFTPVEIKLHSMDTLGSLILLFKQHHGWKSIPIVMLHYFCVAGIHSISQLRSNRPKWNLVLESCVVGLWYMSLGWGRLCMAFLRTIELVFKNAKIDARLIPPKVLQIFHQLDRNLWTARDVSSLAADYVVQHIPDDAMQQNRPGPGYRAQGLESLINALDRLSMQ